MNNLQPDKLISDIDITTFQSDPAPMTVLHHKWWIVLSIIIPMILMLMHVVKQDETYDYRTLDDDGFIGGW